jgi:hypothetical protein
VRVCGHRGAGAPMHTPHFIGDALWQAHRLRRRVVEVNLRRCPRRGGRLRLAVVHRHLVSTLHRGSLSLLNPSGVRRGKAPGAAEPRARTTGYADISLRRQPLVRGAVRPSTEQPESKPALLLERAPTATEQVSEYHVPELTAPHVHESQRDVRAPCVEALSTNAAETMEHLRRAVMTGVRGQRVFSSSATVRVPLLLSRPNFRLGYSRQVDARTERSIRQCVR